MTGEIPYEAADAVLGLAAGNRVAVKIKNSSITSQTQLPSGIIAKTTNTITGGYNEYDKTAFETDGSLIFVFNVDEEHPLKEAKITWVAGIETVYRFNTANATLEEA